MSSVLSRLLPYLLAVLLLGALGWVFWSQDAGGGPRDEIRDVLRRSLTTDRAADCTKLYTRRFLEQVTRERGRAALRECRGDADGDPDAAAIAIRRLRIGPQRAKAVVHIHGEDMDGTVITVGLVNDVLHWKLDHMARVDIDMASYRRAQLAGAAEEGIPRDEARCMIRRVTRTLGERGIERAMVRGGDRVGSMGVSCVSPATVRQMFARELAEEDLPPALAGCILDRVVGDRSAGEVRALLRLGERRQRSAGKNAAIVCARALGLAPAPA